MVGADSRLYLDRWDLPAGNRMPQPAPDRLVLDDLVIDFAGRRLVRGGHEQPLEPKAFAVLALLARSPGRVFTRDEILDAVWGHRHVTQSVLNRIMSLLRQTLGEDAQHPRLLHTVYGIGYRFDLPPAAMAGTGADVDADATGAEELASMGAAPAAAAAATSPEPVRPRRPLLAAIATVASTSCLCRAAEGEAEIASRENEDGRQQNKRQHEARAQRAVEIGQNSSHVRPPSGCCRKA